ncbi:hypothetical protein ACFFRR_009716 [Megaselia abdita]
MYSVWIFVFKILLINAASSQSTDSSYEEETNTLIYEEFPSTTQNIIPLTKLYNSSTAKPQLCSTRDKLKIQPFQTNSSRLKKCCPNGERLQYNVEINQYYCDTDYTVEIVFDPEVLDVTLYDNCIEDNEISRELDILVGNPCNQSVLYRESDGDVIFVIQNGSLLSLDSNRNESFYITNNYCLDLEENGRLYAIVCTSSISGQLEKAQTLLFAFSMLFSVPCLTFLAYIHFRIKELRTIHGLIVGCLSSCLAIGFTLHTVAQISEDFKIFLGHYVLFFMLWYFLWLLALCSNITFIIWYNVRLNRSVTKSIRYASIGAYFIISFSIAFGLAITTKIKGLPGTGMPSYFFQGFTESIRDSQRYFIPPVSFILFTCFGLLVATFFGFKIVEQHLTSAYASIPEEDHNILRRNVKIHQMDRELYENSKKDAKCITFISFLIMIVWILEVITFYSPGNEDSLAFLEILNGLQGMFILIIFMTIRRKRNIITHWWYDRGSAIITPLGKCNSK